MRAKEFITEEINPDVLNPAFNDTQVFDGLTYRATADEEKNGLKFFQVKVFDDNFEKVGIAKFAPHKDAKGNQWLESLITAIHPQYNGKGIARNIYAYVRMLGNTVKPSGDQSDQGRAMWAAWQKSGDAAHLMKEDASSTTIAQLYKGNYPDRDETFWDYVSPSEFDTPLTIQTLPRHKVLIMLLGQYRAEHIDEITDMLDDDRKELVQSYVDDPQLSSKVIVLSGGRIIDGNHRALAAAIKGVPINYIDLADLEETDEIDEVAVSGSSGTAHKWTGNELYRKLV